MLKLKTVLNRISTTIMGVLCNEKHDRYLSRLAKVSAWLSDPYNTSELDPDDVKYRLEIISWLYTYYSEKRDYFVDSPKVKLCNLLRTPAKNMDDRSHVYIKVLYDWENYKRVEGF